MSKNQQFNSSDESIHKPLHLEGLGASQHSIGSDFLIEVKKFVQRLNDLLELGHDSATIQIQWQRYYENLSNEQKRVVWQQAITINQTRSAVARQQQYEPIKTPTSPAIIPNVSPDQRQNLPNITPDSAANYASRVSQPANNPLANPGSYTQPPATSRLEANNYLDIGSRQRYDANAHFQPARRTPQPIIAPNAQAGQGAINMEQVAPDTQVKSKARKTVFWNTDSALFDKKVQKSIWRQNIKSIVFGLTCAVLFWGGYKYQNIYYQYIVPYIQPAATQTNVQVITPPGGRVIEDESFRVIIPNLNISPPVVSGVKKYSSSESAAAFENRIQVALRDGVVHYPTSSFPGEQNADGSNSNVVIVGHSSGTLISPGNFKQIFAKLKTLKLNDLILVNYKQKQYVYKIYEKKIVKPSQVEVLGSAEFNHSLTLITCDPVGTSTNRLVIVAEQINPRPQENRRVDSTTNNNDGIIIPGNSPGLTDSLF